MSFMPIVPVFIIYILAVLLVGFAIYCCINKNFRHTRVFRRIGIGALLLLAFARPVITSGTAERDLSNLNIFFIVDNTGSMAAKDMEQGSKYRYEVMSDDIKRIVKLFPGAKYGAITLDYNSHQSIPLVSDASTINTFADTLKPKYSYRSGDSDLMSLLKYANQRITNYNKRFPERNSIAIFMSDGEDSTNASTRAIKTLEKQIAGGAVIGYGTTNGAVVHAVNYDGEVDETTTIRDSNTGTEHISKLDEDYLAEIASTMNVQYYRRASSDDKLDNINSFTSETIAYGRSGEITEAAEDLYWLPIILAIGLLLWDFYSILDTLLLERKVAK